MKWLIALAFLSFSAQAAECPNHSASLENATAKEAAAACTSLDKILAYFKSIGVDVTPKITFVFEDKVETPQGLAYGYFDTDTNSIHMVHFGSPQEKDQVVWNLKWNDEIAASFLLHETTHLVVVTYMGERFRSISHVAHEFMAYSVQLLLMDQKLRAKVLKLNQNSAFETPDYVSPMVYQMDPNGFAISSYLSLAKWGDPLVIKKIMDGEVRLPSDELPMGY